MDEFRALLRERLARRGALARLAESSGIGASVISRWATEDERKQVRPTPENLRKVAPFLGVPYEDLLRMCEYLPGDSGTPTMTNPDTAALRARTDRLAELLLPYPRAMWSTLMDVFEQMATLPQAVTPQPSISALDTPPLSAPSSPVKRGKPDRGGDLRKVYAPVPAYA